MLVNPFDVITKTEEAYRLKKGTLCNSGRRKLTAEARAVAMYVTRHVTPYSFEEIGDHFNLQYSTVIHACKRVEKIIEQHLGTHAECVVEELFTKFSPK